MNIQEKQQVEFMYKGQVITGEVMTINFNKMSGGTSLDIMNWEENMLYKHIPKSQIVEIRKEEENLVIQLQEQIAAMRIIIEHGAYSFSGAEVCSDWLNNNPKEQE